MRGLHSAVLVLKKYRENLQIYRATKFKTGAKGCMGTKGALSLIVAFKGELLQLINVHLPSGQENSLQRNATLIDIM